ncbi:Srb7 protein [Saccharomycopsis crataegensis]|uniref:Mediator of RNA polymerase II transcription subunit 21 n=1 Tax=Saccharomycopsis crataegensis TaxID=43959 RepID=A0AAV5QEB8_9ASCO|nr:Srb7 protein [Saccharomycopsis crataegensis]
MADRLTQLQICLDQLLEQFCATINYVNTNHDYEPSDNEEKMADKDANVADPKEFKDTMNELSTDIILKTRQIFTIIESLPGIGVSTKDQLDKIESLQNELLLVQKERRKAIKEKNNLLDWCNSMINSVSDDIVETARFS